MPRPAWLAVATLALLHVALSQMTAARADGRPVTYVFTPLVDVVPGGAPLTGAEASALAAEAKSRVDARDIQQAYARMGSTISLDDLLRGIEQIESSDTPLSARQRERVGAILEQARADHAAVEAVQVEILDLEAELSREVEGVLAAIPADVRARVAQRAGGTGGRASGGAAPGGGPGGPGAMPGGAGAPPGGVQPGGPGAPPGGQGAPPAGGQPGGPGAPPGGQGAPPAGGGPGGPSGGAP